MQSPPLRGLAVVLLLAIACGDPVALERQHESIQATTYTFGPQLLYCPGGSTDLAEEYIGTVGGNVALDRSGIDLPSGALDTLRRVRVGVPESDLVEIRVTVGSQEHFTFDEPVEITIDYSRCTRDLSGVELAVWEIDPETKAPLEYMGGVDDKASRTITFTTTHLSGYAMAE